MMKKGFTISALVFIIAMLFSVSHAVVAENQAGYTVEVELIPEDQDITVIPGFQPVRQESLVDDFERASIAPWTTTGYNWGIRDTADVYGPNEPAESGYRFAGIPATDIAGYAGTQTGRLLSPTIDLTGWGALYLSFNYWGDFEGCPTNFDGGWLTISPDNGTTWYQIDSLAEGHLDPTYDSELADGTVWAYCYDTGEGDSVWWWVNVVSLDLMDLGYVSAGNQIKIRFIFKSDQLANGQGWFVDDVKITSYPPPDFQPPVIVHTPLTDTPDTVNAYTVTADVTDEGSGVDTDSVYLYYKIEEGSWNPEQMINTSGDTYEAVIPPQVWHSDVYYYIQATDLASPPNMKTTATYNFEVTDAKTIVYDNGQPYWVPGDLPPGAGIFNNFTFSDVALDSGILHEVWYYFSSAGPFDMKIYEYSAGFPGPLVFEDLGMMSPGYAWDKIEITSEDIHMIDYALAGWIAGEARTETTWVLMDPTLDYPQIMWGYNVPNPGWNQTPYTGGDYMIRLKVIPLPRPIPGIAENDGSQKLSFGLTKTLPNPMHSSTIIEFQTPTTQKITLCIYDVTGQLIKNLVDTEVDAGIHQVTWNGIDDQGRAVASGVYFYQLQGEHDSVAGKLVVTR
jgi:hypothetical protein